MNREVRVEVVIRVVPLDPREGPAREQRTMLRFETETQQRRAEVVGNAARNLYPRAAGVALPTRPQEGGR